MSQAEDLLDSLSEEESSYFAGTSPNERHIVIGKDRFITVPEELKKIAVQGDNNIETVTFDCPRYWDEHDLSLMDIYVHYRRADGKADKHQCDNIVVDETDDTIMHFDWEVARQAVSVMGNLTILVCIKDVDQDIYWYSELNNDLCISEGLEPDGEITEEYSDILEQWKEEVLAAKDVSSEEIESAVKDYMEANPYEETDPTVPDWAKQSTKPTYTAEEVGALPSTTKIPTKTSDLENTNGFITSSVSNLVNYYKKTETYTQDEINQLISLIPKFSIKVVAELPTSDISETTVYLVPYGEESENLYTEYIYVNSTWEILGTQSVDLSGYAKISELPSTLPNPKALTFTGGVTGTYDGSEAKSFKLSKYVDPVAKTDEMTQEVGVDENGGLFTIPSSGDGNGIYEPLPLLQEVTISEETPVVTFDGLSSLVEFAIDIQDSLATAQANFYVRFNGSATIQHEYYGFISTNNSETVPTRRRYIVGRMDTVDRWKLLGYINSNNIAFQRPIELSAKATSLELRGQTFTQGTIRLYGR